MNADKLTIRKLRAELSWYKESRRNWIRCAELESKTLMKYAERVKKLEAKTKGQMP